MQETLIRPITEKDNAVMAGIIRKSLEEFGANKPGTVYFDTTTDHLSDLFQQKNSGYFILQEGDSICGGGGYFPTAGLPEGTCELVKMYLSGTYRGKGYGKKLLHYCMTKARESGYTKMYIESMPELKNAISLYKKFGFSHLAGPLGNSGHTGCDVWMIADIGNTQL